MSTAAATSNGQAIERRYGATAAAEWRVLLNRLDLGEGFALIVLVVPDMDGARLCRAELEAWLARRGRTVAVIEPDAPAALYNAATRLLTLADAPDRGAIWLAAVPSPALRDKRAWDNAWRHALVGLNQQRNPLRRRFPLPVILVGDTDLVVAMREIAADLWSVRALSLRIVPEQVASGLDHSGNREHARTEASDGAAAPDPELALRMAERVRGRPEEERTLASLLVRAGEGFAAKGKWREAEAAWREAAGLFERHGEWQKAAWTWTDLGDYWWHSGPAHAARDAFAKALAISERLARDEPDRADFQRDLVVSLVRQAEIADGVAARDYLQRALGIVEALQASGRLGPADAGMLPALRQRLDASPP